MAAFSAYRAHQIDGRVVSRLDTLRLDDLDPGDVVIRAAWSDINFKDALAATGAGKIQKRFPLVGGIDVAGHVAQSTDPRFRDGDAVLVVGCGLGEVHDGGYAEYVRVPGDWVVPLPAGLGLREAMAIGTAGFTAALGIHQLEHLGLAPGQGPVLVSGATGGVGSLAIDMLAGRGYEVVALSGKRAEADYLAALGAARVLWRDELDLGSRPLETARWAACVDNLGGEVLTYMTRTVQPFGSIASIGLAAGPALVTTVMPFILRGVNLLGINSTYCPAPIRARVWQRLGADLAPRHLDRIVSGEVALAELPDAFAAYLSAGVTGRKLVRIGA